MSKLIELWTSFPRLVFVSGVSYVELKNMRKEFSRRHFVPSFAYIVRIALCALSEKLDALEDDDDGVV